MSTVYNALCITLIEDKKISLINNAYNDGYSFIVLENTDSSEVYTIPTVNKNTIINCKGDYGDYNIHAENEYGDKTPALKILLLQESRDEILQMCCRIAGVKSSDRIIKSAINRAVNADSSILISLSHSVATSTDESYKMMLFKLLYTYISLINKRIKSFNYNNLVDIEIDVIRRIMTADDTLDSVIQYDLSNPSARPNIFKDLIDNNIRTVPLSEDKLYRFEAVLDNCVVNIQYMYCPINSICSEYWKNKYSVIQEIENLTNKEIYYPSQYMEFSDYEKEILSIADKAEMYSPLFKRPVVTREDYAITISFNDYDKIKALNDIGLNICVGWCMVDEVNDNNIVKNAISIDSEELYFDMRKYGMYEEDYFFFICDEYNSRYSNLTLVDLAEYIDESFNERKRRLELFNYNKHLSPLIGSTIPNNLEIINDAFNSCETDEATCASDIADMIISTIAQKNSNHLSLPKIVATMYQDKIVYGDYLVEYYDSPFYFKHKISTITLPPAKDTLYVITAYRSGTEPSTDYYLSKEDSAIDIRITKELADIYLVRGYNLTTKKQSGFVQVNYTSQKVSLNKFLVNIEVA